MLRLFLFGKTKAPPQPNFPVTLGAWGLPAIEADSSVKAVEPVIGSASLTVFGLPSIEAATERAYKLTYSGNGNDGGSAPVDTSWYSHGSFAEVSGEGTLTLSGHTFDGWSTEPEGGGARYSPEDSIEMLEPTTLYAQWAEE